jgi:hypothetical protein
MSTLWTIFGDWIINCALSAAYLPHLDTMWLFACVDVSRTVLKKQHRSVEDNRWNYWASSIFSFNTRTGCLLAIKYVLRVEVCHFKHFLYTGCHRRKGQNFGRVFLMLKYTDITQNTYIQSWTVTDIVAREVWNFDICYTHIDYQTHIKTGRNMWFL